MHAPTVVILGFLNNNLSVASVGKIRKYPWCTRMYDTGRVVGPTIAKGGRGLSGGKFLKRFIHSVVHFCLRQRVGFKYS